MSKAQVPKKVRPFIQAARDHGARIVDGSKHLKVYDGDELVGVFKRGSSGGQYEGRHDMQNIRKAWRERGWME
jgi:hypothetical protein